MTRAITNDPLADGSDTTVELGVLAVPGQLSVTRAVAATLAAQEDFDLDDIADIRLAIDEANSRLIVRAVPGSRLVCRFTPTDHALEVTITATTDASVPVDAAGFSWHVLNALTDSVSTSVEESASGVVTSTISFVKNKPGPVG